MVTTGGDEGPEFIRRGSFNAPWQMAIDRENPLAPPTGDGLTFSETKPLYAVVLLATASWLALGVFGLAIFLII